MVEHVKIIGKDAPDADPMRVDNTADGDAAVVVDVVHTRAHRGQLFEVDFNNASLADAGTVEILVVVTQAAHVRFHGVSGGDARLEFFENTTVSANGTGSTPINRNRFSSNVATTAFYLSPTITADGDELSNQLLAGGTGPAQSSGGTAPVWLEWILSPGNYLVRLTNISGAAQPVHVEFDFYEDL